LNVHYVRVHISMQCVPRREHSALPRNTGRWMRYTVLMTVYSAGHTEHADTLRGKSAELLELNLLVRTYGSKFVNFKFEALLPTDTH